MWFILGIIALLANMPGVAIICFFFAFLFSGSSSNNDRR